MRNVLGSFLLIGLLASCDYRHNNEFHQAMVKGGKYGEKGKYKIIKTSQDYELAIEVQKHMDEGWVPQGGVAVETDGIYHK